MLLKQKNSRHFTKSAKKAGSLRNPFLSPVFSRAAGDSLTCTYIPLAVLKPHLLRRINTSCSLTCTYIPLAVLKHSFIVLPLMGINPYMYIHTACGIETSGIRTTFVFTTTYMYIHTACGIETHGHSKRPRSYRLTCTYIPLAVLTAKPTGDSPVGFAFAYVFCFGVSGAAEASILLHVV